MYHIKSFNSPISLLNLDELNIIFKQFLGNDILMISRHVNKKWSNIINVLIHKHYNLKLKTIIDKSNQIEIENYQLHQNIKDLQDIINDLFI